VLAYTVLLLFSLSGGSDPGARLADLARAGLAHAAAIGRQGQSIEARYLAEARKVSNWRIEAAGDLEPRPIAAAAALMEADRPLVTRCVKLNNYWCIKSARWEGELGTDEEGHVGFRSAESGADAAAVLLRRYYLEFGRKSALDIVRRWAPAECNTVSGPGGLLTLAVRGIGSTLRARYLASRGRKGPGKGSVSFTSRVPGGRVSAIIPRAGPAFRIPEIAVGLGETRTTTLSSRLPMRIAPSRAPGKPAGPAARQGKVAAADAPAPAGASPAPVTACVPDEQRIRNYAARIVADLGLEPTDDLALFEADGTPRPNLPRVMLAMSSVELGILHASTHLIEGAVERAAQRAATAPEGNP
jgi:hypothetical protein